MTTQTTGGGDPIGLLRGTGYEPGRHMTAYPMEQRSMLRVLADRAANRGDHPWIVFDGVETLTFAHGYELVRRFAAAVLDRFGRGVHVGLFLRNQLEFMPAFYGAQGAGGVAVPFNADARGPLLEYVLEQSDAELLVARADLLDRLADLDTLGKVRVVVVVGEVADPPQLREVDVVGWDDFVSRHEPAELAMPSFDDVALIQFTSGTTSFSKGAVYPHHFLYLYSATLSDSLHRSEDDVLSTPLPLYHVAALHIIVNSALHAGCTAHLKTRFSASKFWDQAADDGATFSIILGPMAAIIMKTITGEIRPHKMETMFCVPPPPGKDEFEQRFGVRMLWQGYGMTEVYPLPMRFEMIPGVDTDTIGMPAAYYDYGVVDEHDRLVPPGVEGELVFRPLLPHAMMREYYKNPEATVRALRNFAFHTGDIAAYDEQGLVHYRGRMQERIRRRGENVSAFELELVALRHDQVIEAAAYGVPSEFGEHDVKLDVIVKNDCDLAELHRWLDKNLPRYMVPRYLERRESFPKTPSERVEKFKLAAESPGRPGVFDAGR